MNKSFCCFLQRVIGTIILIALHHFKAMAIKEHIGYPDHILQESNQKLDQEYAHVSKSLVSSLHCKQLKDSLTIDVSHFSF